MIQRFSSFPTKSNKDKNFSVLPHGNISHSLFPRLSMCVGMCAVTSRGEFYCSTLAGKQMSSLNMDMRVYAPTVTKMDRIPKFLQTKFY